MWHESNCSEPSQRSWLQVIVLPTWAPFNLKRCPSQRNEEARRGAAKVLIFSPAAASVAVGLPRALPADGVTTNHTGPSDTCSLWPTA